MARRFEAIRRERCQPQNLGCCLVALQPAFKASDFAILCAAEVTLQHGCRHFKVIGGREFSNAAYDLHTIPIFKPDFAFKIQCSNKIDRPCYDAVIAFAEIRKTYKLGKKVANGSLRTSRISARVYGEAAKKYFAEVARLNSPLPAAS
jgi:hypothetical protein